MTDTADLFPQLNADVRYLLDKNIELDNRECDACACPVSNFYLVKRGTCLGARCASCGATHTYFNNEPVCIPIHDESLHRIVEQHRWDCTIRVVEERFGGPVGWWSIAVSFFAWHSHARH
jgi:hypothetical protein